MRHVARLPALACTGLFPLLAGCFVHVESGGYSDREQVHFLVEGRPTITLATFDGAVEVTSWDKDEVLVQVESRAATRELLETIDLDASKQDTRIQVTVTAADLARWDLASGGDRRSARLIATVPRDADVRITSGDGSVQVERVRGRIEARTEDGRIVMRQVGGAIVAHSGDGSVQVEDVDGQCTVNTRDGSVVVSGRLRGGFSATSGDGGVTVRAARGSVVTEDWDIETADGAVTLALPDEMDARLDLQTSDGRIALNGFPDLPIAREGEGRRLDAVIGKDGAGRLRIRTGDGSITLKRSYVPAPPEPPQPPTAPPAPPAPSSR